MLDAKNIHGAIVHEHLDRKDSLFRVSLKAVILNDKGHLLTVKESDRDWWDLPGGGLDHGETLKEALARELKEEVSLEGDFTFDVLLAEDPHYIEHLNLYQLRITFLVTPQRMIFEAGVDGDAVQFIDATVYEHSDLYNEQNMFRFSELAKARLALG